MFLINFADVDINNSLEGENTVYPYHTQYTVLEQGCRLISFVASLILRPRLRIRRLMLKIVYSLRKFS